MRLVHSVVPSLVLFVLIVLTVFPWGVTGITRQVLPLLPALAILAMNLRQANAVPVWMVFAGGLVFDAMAGEPLGFWALIYLAVNGVAGALHPSRYAGRIAGWLTAAAALSVVVVLEWALASIYALQATPWLPLVRGAIVALLLFPVLDTALTPFVARSDARGDEYLLRGG